MLRSNANSADPDQISLQSAISEPELHYLHLRNALFSSYKQLVYNVNIRRVLRHNFRIYIGCKARSLLLLRARLMRYKYEGTKTAVRQIF